MTERCQTDSSAPSPVLQSQDRGAARAPPLEVQSGWDALPTPFCQKPGEKKGLQARNGTENSESGATQNAVAVVGGFSYCAGCVLLSGQGQAPRGSVSA